MRRIAIIGAGASGMMAAITAAAEGAAVTLIEHTDKVGKKILSTGNGRCNFTNINQEPICYRSDNPDFAWGIIQRFTAQEAISFFLKLGIYSRNRDGYLYPRSDQAVAVLDVLKMELERLGVQVLKEKHVQEIKVKKRGFQIRLDSENVVCDKVILATGSKAAPKTGSDGSGYDLAKALGHHMTPVVPALVQLRCKETFYKRLAGIRVWGRVELYVDGECMAADTGELQLTNYGISGIPVFQVSRYAARGLYEKRQVKAKLDFMPEFDREGFLHFLEKRICTHPEKRLSEFLVGIFHPQLSRLWIELLKLDREKRVGDLTKEECIRLVSKIKCFETIIGAANTFEQAQVCAGGIDTSEVNADTLESMLVDDLYFAGEILDVDGICGGYNLQWAWSSGYVAGKEAAKSKE